MPDPVRSTACYTTSSYSGSQDCVEVMLAPTAILVRDTKDRTRPPLTFTPDSWQAFVAAIKDGRL